MQAIETNYGGYRFRSRLEARWAVVFDCMGLRWEYEPEGFEMGDGVRYLPDFRLPELSLWLEVKPPIPVAAEDVKKIGAFQFALAQSSANPWRMLVLWGTPGEHEIRNESNASGASEFLSCPKCRRVLIGQLNPVKGEGDPMFTTNCPTCGPVVDSLDRFHLHRVRLHAAITESRQIRFEELKPLHAPAPAMTPAPPPSPVRQSFQQSSHAGIHRVRLESVREIKSSIETGWGFTFAVMEGSSKGHTDSLDVVVSKRQSSKAQDRTRSQLLILALRLGVFEKVTRPDGNEFVQPVPGKEDFCDCLGAECLAEFNAAGRMSGNFPASSNDSAA